MLTSPAPSVPEQQPCSDLVELPRRERAFVCPTGLHDFCSSAARHDLPVDDGLTG